MSPAPTQTALITRLVCLRCGNALPGDPHAYLCPRCEHGTGPSDAGVLDVEYDYELAASQLFDSEGRISSQRTDLLRYLALLPLSGPAGQLPAGGTPLIRADRLAGGLGVGRLHLKDETRNPTRALKDRATSVGVSRALEQGADDVVCASAGNAAISLAAFAAHAGLRAHAFVPRDTAAVRLDWLRALGADVHRSEGDYDDAYEEAEATRAQGWYSRNCAYNPYLVEGKKTCGLEIGEQLGWRAPDVVICPVGDACTLAAIGKGFRELRLLGRTERVPRLVGVQAEGAAPMAARFGDREWEPSGGEPRTKAASINVQHPRNATRLLNELAESGGAMVTVTDEQMAAAQAKLASDAGLIAEISSAATLAALENLAAQEDLSGAEVVLVITGGRTDEPIADGGTA
jgi:threonine synthase